MAVGLPGLGLSGLFCLVATFLMPILRPQGRRQARATFDRVRLFCVAVGASTAAVSSWGVIDLIMAPTHGGLRLPGSSHGMSTLVLSALLMCVVVGVASVARRRRRPVQLG